MKTTINYQGNEYKIKYIIDRQYKIIENSLGEEVSHIIRFGERFFKGRSLDEAVDTFKTFLKKSVKGGNPK